MSRAIRFLKKSRGAMSPHAAAFSSPSLHARQQSILQPFRQSVETSAIGRFRFRIERPEAEPPRLAVTRHSGVADSRPMAPRCSLSSTSAATGIGGRRRRLRHDAGRDRADGLEFLAS